MTRKLTRKNIVKKLDTVFSEYIRRKYADKLGNVKCYTCKKKHTGEARAYRMDILFLEPLEL